MQWRSGLGFDDGWDISLLYDRLIMLQVELSMFIHVHVTLEYVRVSYLDPEYVIMTMTSCDVIYLFSIVIIYTREIREWLHVL